MKNEIDDIYINTHQDLDQDFSNIYTRAIHYINNEQNSIPIHNQSESADYLAGTKSNSIQDNQFYNNERQSEISQNINRKEKSSRAESILKEDFQQNNENSKDEESYFDELTSSRNEITNQFNAKSSQFNTLISSNFVNRKKSKY